MRQLWPRQGDLQRGKQEAQAKTEPQDVVQVRTNPGPAAVGPSADLGRFKVQMGLGWPSTLGWVQVRP